MPSKNYQEQDVHSASIERIDFILDNFPRYIISFSGGKDSSVLLQILIERARLKNRLPVDVLFIDLEAQYNSTIKHVEEMMINNPDVNPYWIALPINLRNSVSVYQSQWQPWNPDEKDKWVREMPEYKGVIGNINYFPFFYYGMEFEDFVVDFAKWYSQGELTASIIGIRTDESLNRYRTIRNDKKIKFNNYGWTTKITESVFNVYPIYDWRTEDIWHAVGKFDYKYNKIYDLMYAQGKTIHECRICQPYGDDQRKGLDLFRTCEPETWDKVVQRVSGANYGNMYANTFLMGRRKVLLPEGHTWKSYTQFLLHTLPKFEAEWYKIKFQVFVDYWLEKGFPSYRLEKGEKIVCPNCKSDDININEPVVKNMELTRRRLHFQGDSINEIELEVLQMVSSKLFTIEEIVTSSENEYSFLIIEQMLPELVKKGYVNKEEEEEEKYNLRAFSQCNQCSNIFIIPDEGPRRLESKRKIPSWRRIAEVIIKNDKLCKRLSFAGTVNQYQKYEQLREIYGS